MTSSNEETNMDVLNELLAERGRYEGWLAQLDQRRSTTPLHVLERVRTDYSARLDAVLSQLRGRAVELESTVASLRSRLAALAAEEEQRRDERAETELRASVGEFTDDRARSTIGECDAAIDHLVAQRQAVSSELTKLQDVLAQVIPAPAPAAEELVSVDSLAPDPEPVRTETTHPEPVTSQAAVEELEFLRSVVAPQDVAAPSGAQQASAPTASDTASPDLLAPPVLAAPRRQVTPLSNAIPGIRDPLRSVGGDGSLTPGNMPAFLKDMPSEQVKTLKCQECGTMNYPTEWYCERCGGELAAM